MNDEKLSEHFRLSEFIPSGIHEDDIPVDVITNIETLAVNILEPLREAMVLPVAVHSGYRPPAHNAAVGGKAHSDHLTGSAADFNIPSSEQRTWQQNTIQAFHWIRTQLEGEFGQIILEDHRISTGSASKLWVHVAITTLRHPGTPADPNRVLCSSDPNHYFPFDPAKAPLE